VELTQSKITSIRLNITSVDAVRSHGSVKIRPIRERTRVRSGRSGRSGSGNQYVSLTFTVLQA